MARKDSRDWSHRCFLWSLLLFRVRLATVDGRDLVRQLLSLITAVSNNEQPFICFLFHSFGDQR